MPYINEAARDWLEEGDTSPRTAGELNYVIHRDISRFLRLCGANTTHYEDHNAVIGVLQCVMLELYRRLVGPYEDAKRGENGDVEPYGDG